MVSQDAVYSLELYDLILEAEHDSYIYCYVKMSRVHAVPLSTKAATPLSPPRASRGWTTMIIVYVV
jgi:hypothetical protein